MNGDDLAKETLARDKALTNGSQWALETSKVEQVNKDMPCN
jgi:hypothetical protein